VASRSEAELMAMLGKADGRYVHAVAQLREPRPVQRRRGRRSFGAQRALRPGDRPRDELDAALADLGERLARRMERRSRTGRTVVLRLRFGDYAHVTRSSTLAHPTGDAAAITAAGRRLLDAAMPLVRRRGITLLGLTVTNLAGDGAAGQLTLPLFEEKGGDGAVGDPVGGA
jgi:DNA polymerase-4